MASKMQLVAPMQSKWPLHGIQLSKCNFISAIDALCRPTRSVCMNLKSLLKKVSNLMELFVANFTIVVHFD